MFKAIAQFFNMFLVFFAAGEKVAKAIDNLAGIAEREASILAEQMEIEGGARLALIRRDAQLAIAGTTAPSKSK